MVSAVSVQAVEPLRVVEHGGVAARPDVGENGGDGVVDVRRAFALGARAWP